VPKTESGQQRRASAALDSTERSRRVETRIHPTHPSLLPRLRRSNQTVPLAAPAQRDPQNEFPGFHPPFLLIAAPDVRYGGPLQGHGRSYAQTIGAIEAMDISDAEKQPMLGGNVSRPPNLS
jgi:hypothetical protein